MVEKPSNDVGKVIVEALESEQVEYVFGLVGTHVLPIFDALADRPQIRHIVSKHESNAAYMASMYGYLTGRPGVVLVTAGPGATNSLSGVAQAYVASNPMVHISGDVPLGSGNEAFHGVDREDFLHKMFNDITKWSVRAERIEDIPGILSKAFLLAVSGRPGPVHVDIPINLQLVEPGSIKPYAPTEVEKQVPSKDSVDRVRSALAKARKPMICAGRGVLLHRAEAALVALAEAVSAPVVCTVYGDGSISDDHPLAVGIFDEWSGNRLAWELLTASDLLLMIGMRSDTVLTRKLVKRAPNDSILIAFDETNTLRSEEGVGVAFASDSQLFLDRLLDHTDDFRRAEDSLLYDKIAGYKRTFQKGLRSHLAQFDNHESMHFGLVLRELAAQMNENALVVAGWGNHRDWARIVLPVRGRESFMGETAWGTLGYELPGGIASKLVYPDRQVIVITGDGSLLMTVPDLVTAVEEGANILVVVLNDSCYGIINVLQEFEFGRSYGDKIGEIDFAQLAESFGAHGVRVKSPQELSEGISQALKLSDEGPVILDAVCSHVYGQPGRKAIFELGLERDK